MTEPHIAGAVCPPEVVEKARTIGALDGVSVRALAADTDILSAETVKTVLAEEGYSANIVPGTAQAVKDALTDAYYIIFINPGIPGLEGVDFIRELKKSKPGMLIVAMIDAGAFDKKELLKSGAYNVIEKPIDAGEFRNHLTCWALVAERRKQVDEKYAVTAPARKSLKRLLRKRWLALALIFALVMLTGILIPPVNRALAAVFDGIGSAFRSLTKLVGIAERVDGYLQRDEQREIEKER